MSFSRAPVVTSYTDKSHQYHIKKFVVEKEVETSPWNKTIIASIFISKNTV